MPEAACRWLPLRIATARLREIALAGKADGVGYYPVSDFVHLDIGHVRSWSG